jgi:hypothetical protein
VQFDDARLQIHIAFPNPQGLVDTGAAAVQQSEQDWVLNGILPISGCFARIDHTEVPFNFIICVDMGLEFGRLEFDISGNIHIKTLLLEIFQKLLDAVDP